jgi:hypothetical protein
MEADKDGDGKLSFEEFSMMVANTVSTYAHSASVQHLNLRYALQDIVKQMTLEDLF